MSHSAANPVRPAQHVLIAGCGYLGRRAAQRWTSQGVEITAITRSDTKAGELANAGIDVVVGDLGSGQLPPLPPVDTVLWSVGFDRSSGQAREAIWIDGLRFLQQQLPSSVRRFLYVSSTGVYGETEGETVSEATRPRPTTDSGRCCLQAEQLLRDVLDETSDEGVLTVFRMAGLYGPGRLLRRVSDLQARVPLSGSPDNYLNLIHIDDAVTALAALQPRNDVPLINVVNTGTLTRGEYYRELARLTEAPDPVFDEGAAPSRGGNKRVVSTVRDELGLCFQFDNVTAGLQQAVDI